MVAGNVSSVVPSRRGVLSSGNGMSKSSGGSSRVTSRSTPGSPANRRTRDGGTRMRMGARSANCGTKRQNWMVSPSPSSACSRTRRPPVGRPSQSGCGKFPGCNRTSCRRNSNSSHPLLQPAGQQHQMGQGIMHLDVVQIDPDRRAAHRLRLSDLADLPQRGTEIGAQARAGRVKAEGFAIGCDGFLRAIEFPERIAEIDTPRPWVRSRPQRGPALGCMRFMAPALR